ncbi:MAG: DUF5681 domain-containing protein [Planctomycetota bacterium]
MVPGHRIGEATRWRPGQSGNPRGRPSGRAAYEYQVRP